jgi:WD40 repeat protein
MAAINNDATIDEALAFYFECVDRGEKIDVAALVEKFPHCAAELQSFFADEQQLHERLLAISSDPNPLPQSPIVSQPFRGFEKVDDLILNSRFEQVDQLADEFEAAIRAGEKPQIEAYLDRVAQADRPAVLAELLKVEIELRHAGLLQPECLDEYLTRFVGMESVVREACRRDVAVAIAGSRAGFGQLNIRCPNCHAPTQVAADTVLTDLTCGSCGSQFRLVDQTKEEGTTPILAKLGRFELMERLGVGGFGSVWKAHDKELDRTVAIKVPRAGDMTRDEQEKFFREARAAAQLCHPGIVSVHEVGRDGESVYIVSDFVQGVTLGDWLTGQQPTGREAAELCAKVADALHHAHEQGVIHRDLKPANILIDTDGQPHIMDFGLARREVGEVTVTMDGHVLGTPAYMSPEQAKGESHTADRRSDVYSLGVILFQILTGEAPFRGNARMLVHQVIHEEAPSPRKLNANISKDLETITLKCLQKEPSKRYQTARELSDEFRRILAGEPIHARPVGRIARAWRWAKRKPAIAGLSAAVAGLLVGTIVVLAVSNERVRRQSAEKDEALQARTVALREKNSALESAKKNLELANRNEEAAKRNAERAEQSAKTAELNAEIANRRHYAAQMNLASQAWRNGEHMRTVQLLETLRPSQYEQDLRGFEWRHVYHLAHANVVHRWRAQKDTIVDMVWPQETVWFATASIDGAVRFWNGRTGESSGAIQTSKGAISDIASTPDGQLLVAAHTAGHVTLWDVPSRREIRRWSNFKYDSQGVRTVDISPDKQFVVAGTWGVDKNKTFGWVKAWHIQNPSLPPFTDSDQLVHKLAFSPDGTLLAVNSKGHPSLTLWSMGAEPKKLGAIDFGDVALTQMVFSADGKTLWCGSRKGPFFRKIDMEKRAQVAGFAGHQNIVQSLVVIPGQTSVVTASLDRTLRRWNTDTGQSSVIGAEANDIYSIAMSPTGNRIACGDADGWITLRDFDSAPSIAKLNRKEGDHVGNRIASISYSSDGGRLYIGDSSLHEIDARTLQFEDISMPTSATSNKSVLAISNDCALSASCDVEAVTLTVTNLATKSSEHTFDVGPVNCAQFSPDRRFLAALKRNQGGDLTICDLHTGKIVIQKPSSRSRPQAVAFAPNSSHVAMSFSDPGIVVFDVLGNVVIDTKHPLQRQQVARALRYSPDGTILASGYTTGEIFLWDVDPASGSLTLRSHLQGHASVSRDLAFSPDGTRLASATSDPSVRLWDVSTGQETMNFEIDGRLLAFSPQGDQLAVVDYDNSVHVLRASPLESAAARVIPKGFMNTAPSARSTNSNPKGKTATQIREAVATLVNNGELSKALRMAAAGDENDLRVVMDAAFDPKCLAAFEPKRLLGYNLTAVGDIRMAAGDAPAAEEAYRLPLGVGATHPYWYYLSLGWCLLAQNQNEKAQQAFEQCLHSLRQPDGAFNLAQADIDQLTAAYFLDLISEQEFLDHAGSRNHVSFSWFIIGQRREIEGKVTEAISAYDRSIEAGVETPHQWVTFSRWRLIKLRDAQKNSAPASKP